MRLRKSPDWAPWMTRWSYVEVSVITLLMALRAIASAEAPCHSGGYSIAPTPMIVPWPRISRGTEWLVPIVPGLVSEIVVPWKSSTPRAAMRALRTTSSYAVQNAAKSIVSAPLMFGTSSCRVPSFFCMSIARPRLIWAGVIWLGLPSMVSKPTFISGIALSALTRAKPMMWVNETLPPRARDRWLLMTILLSQSSLTGTERTEVAVGTVRESSMLATVRAGAPRSTVYVGWPVAGLDSGAVPSWGVGLPEVLAFSAAASGRGRVCVAGV